MPTPLIGRSILRGAVALLLLAGGGVPVIGFLTASKALAQEERHDDRARGPDRGPDWGRDGRDRHPEYDYYGYSRPVPVYSPPAVVYAPPGPPPVIDFVFPINIR